MKEWLRAIVRVWKGRPNDGGVYLGTAFFIAPGYLLTCKHVVEGIPYKSIFLQSDTGAFPEGGVQSIEPYVAHPYSDVAYLPLVKPVPDANCVPLGPRRA